MRDAPLLLTAVSFAAVPASARADDWSSVGTAVLAAYVLMGIFAAQQLLMLILAVLRARTRGLKSAIGFYLGSVLVVPASIAMLVLLSDPMDEFGPNWTRTPIGLLSIVGLVALLFCAIHLILVWQHDRRPENRVWKATQ